ncbi:sulfate ABC transporter substrate-binding protein [Aquamicrobium zhengzhouense]|uniref:Sulfate ABC transporter substrate-binding protein n=1 Tax=Aquamicrobium zhengzhouense TaxID=2781738 RepID=A0ABS0S973_9HYPH|nr:sulfate ABC transporter substrate-binding protein [Aquamicrobium zhengzhouense]MBI1619792.1 sulfate ABC transporter substrate-binding protein [Aquamicrobium zhengzhouense]
MSLNRTSFIVAATIAVSAQLGAISAASAQDALTNVSYDPTRELYRKYNAAFAKHWQEKTGKDVTVSATHGGSGSQVRTVIDGLPADVLTLALASDILAAQEAGLIDEGWQSEFPKNSSPYYSTIVFLVRSGNPKNIKDWNDLIRDDIEVITPNPKSSGGARWNYLAAWAYQLERSGGDEGAAKEFVGQLFARVPVLDSGARGSTNTFVKNGLGDVLLAWENEAFLAIEELEPGSVEIVVPPLSILAEPPVAIVDKNVDERGTRELAKAYLDYLYSPEGQKIIASSYYRPQYPEHAAEEDVKRFPDLKLVTIDDTFGGWAEAQKKHFADGGIFDQIYSSN